KHLLRILRKRQRQVDRKGRLPLLRSSTADQEDLVSALFLLIDQLGAYFLDRLSETEADRRLGEPHFLLFLLQERFQILISALMINHRIERRIQLSLHVLFILHTVPEIGHQRKQDDHHARPGYKSALHHAVPLERRSGRRRIIRLFKHFQDHVPQHIL